MRDPNPAAASGSRLRLARLVGLALATAGNASIETTFVDYDQNLRTLPAGDPYCSVPIDRIYDGRMWTRTTTCAHREATLTKQTHNMADSIFPAACAYLA
jgi:hypothetical protein